MKSFKISRIEDSTLAREKREQCNALLSPLKCEREPLRSQVVWELRHQKSAEVQKSDTSKQERLEQKATLRGEASENEVREKVSTHYSPLLQAHLERLKKADIGTAKRLNEQKPIPEELRSSLSFSGGLGAKNIQALNAQSKISEAHRKESRALELEGQARRLAWAGYDSRASDLRSQASSLRSQARNELAEGNRMMAKAKK